ncbi:hypothetical protein MBN09_01480 [Candidatus Saccharibacteria bacterium]|nr:hypothetical protein [Candidatus Saccharibacteria bacterium]
MADKFDFDLEVNPIETGPKNQNKETGVSANSVHFNAQASEPAKTQSVDTEIPKTESSSVLSDDLINNMADSISEESVENPILAAEVTEDIAASGNFAASENFEDSEKVAASESVEDSEGIEASEKIEASKNTDTSENTEISENKDHILDEVLKENNYEEPTEDIATTASSSSAFSASEFVPDSASDSASDSTHESISDSASENTEANTEAEAPAKKKKTKAQKIFPHLLAALVAAGIALFVYFFFFANVSASTFSKIFHKISGSDIEFRQFVTGDALNTKGESQIQQADLRVNLSRGSTENSAAVHATLNFTMKGDNSPILLGLEGILAQDGKIYLKLDHLKDSLTAVLKGSGKEIDSEMQKSLDDFAMEIENKWQRIDAEEVIAGLSGALGFTLP